MKMIINFPQPFSDELLYSVVARYRWLGHSPNDRSFRRQIFGQQDVKQSIDFPTRLGAFQSAYGPNSPWDIPKIIQAMTLLPFYAPFLPADRFTILKNALSGDGGNASLGKGIKPGRGVPRHDYLRFCPSCAAEERRTNGEAYWHRLPQLPGVYICPIHRVFFEDSAVSLASFKAQATYLAAEDVILPGTARGLDSANPSHMTLFRVAEIAAALANRAIDENPGAPPCQDYVLRAMQLG